MNYSCQILLVLIFGIKNQVEGKMNALKLIGEVVLGINYSHNSDATDREIYNDSVIYPTIVIERYGYPAENHSVTTSDGYRLTLHRIPHGKVNTAMKNRKPLLLIHGILMSSAQWFDAQAYSMVYYLVDLGYDVWLGNLRGNFFTSHERYSRHQKEFWDFSWEQMADYDIPGTIDYILDITANDKLIYIGHSMGTTVGLACFATQPHYNKKVAGFVALSPIASLTYMTTPIRILAKLTSELSILVEAIDYENILYVDKIFWKPIQNFCPSSDPFYCSLAIYLTGGYDPYLRNVSRDFVFVARAAAGTSRRTLVHYGQMFLKKGMYRYDYGYGENLLKYNSVTPPKYDLTQISIPVAIFYGANDGLADPLDVYLLTKELPNLIDYQLINFTLFHHADIMYAMNGSVLFHTKVASDMAKMWKM